MHVWLPMAMEGIFKIFLPLIILYFDSLCIYLIKLIYLNTSHNNTYFKVVKITIKTPHNKLIRAIHTNSKGPSYIWVYDFTKLSYNENCLVKGAPFKTKTGCANVLKTTRNSVRLYLDSYKIFNNKWIFSSSELSKEQLSKFLIPSKVWEVVTGAIVGDGHISYDPINKPKINGRLEFTFSAKILHYVNYFKFNVLAPICTYSNPTPWPRMEGKKPTQYWFCTKSLPAITNLYQFWYKQIDGKFIKVLPFNIEELLSPIALAHWIMGDAYFTEGSLKLCTDNFTKNEVLRLIDVLYAKYSIKATINKRTNPSAPLKWRTGISRLSLDKLRRIFDVRPYIISEMTYKLGIK